jgi:hypothetical protein
VEVADLLWTAACRRPQQQQQQQEKCRPCVCEGRGEADRSGFDYEGTTYGLVGLFVFESGLAAILMIFPGARTCIFAVLAWAKIIRIARPIPESAPNNVEAPVEASVAAPVRGNCQF